MTDRNFKPDSGTDLVFEDAGSTDRLRITDGGSTILYEDGGAAALTIDTSGRVGIGTANPNEILHINDTTSVNTTIKMEGDDATWDIANVGSGLGDLRFWDGSVNVLTLENGGNVGIGTTAPGQIFDCNSGSGNMIADGYDTHSLAVYKENIEDASGYLDKVLACPAQKWNRKPFVSADEIKEAVLEEFSETVWKEYFPEDNSHRQKALYNMPEGDLKTWIDEWCEVKRVEMRPEDKWQKKRLGLVADAELTAEHLPEVISINDDGEPTGIDTMTYIGILHNAIQELSVKVTALESA